MDESVFKAGKKSSPGSLHLHLMGLEIAKSQYTGRKQKRMRTKINKKINDIHHRIYGDSELHGNVVPSHMKGCYIVRFSDPLSVWKDRFETIDYSEYGVDSLHELSECVPDITIDPETDLCTVFNTSDKLRSFFITIIGAKIGVLKPDNSSITLVEGCFRNEEAKTFSCTTLVVLLQPYSLVDIGKLLIQPPLEKMTEIKIESDVKDITNIDMSEEIESNLKIFFAKFKLSTLPTYIFPFLNEKESFLCSQGFNGHFTHFFPGTRYAVDLASPLGCEVVSMGDGRVVDIKQSNDVSGIHCSNLFKWNSIMIHLDDGNFVEYVHIAKDSVCVTIGQRVRAGDKLCQTGDIGFCPSPHIHIQVTQTSDADAETIPFAFAVYTPEKGLPSETSMRFIPIAGERYNKFGLIDACDM